MSSKSRFLHALRCDFASWFSSGDLARMRRRIFGIPLLDRMFPVLQRLGVHVTRNHFYEPVPDTGRLPNRLWDAPSDVTGVDMREADQLRLLEEIAEGCAEELAKLPADPVQGHRYYLNNPQFGTVDAHLLHGVMRRLKPARVVEVGGGFSTELIVAAAKRNKAERPERSCEITTIEPYPSPMLKEAASGLILREVPVQDVPVAVFERLGPGDVMFIDSSHVLKIGSDVQYMFLEVIPRLRPGVWVHVHDVYLPWEYPRHLVVDWHRFWTEQYILQAFLAFNSAFELRWASHFMERVHRERLEAALGPVYPRTSGLPPSSVWMERVR